MTERTGGPGEESAHEAAETAAVLRRNAEADARGPAVVHHGTHVVVDGRAPVERVVLTPENAHEVADSLARGVLSDVRKELFDLQLENTRLKDENSELRRKLEANAVG